MHEHCIAAQVSKSVALVLVVKPPFARVTIHSAGTSRDSVEYHLQRSSITQVISRIRFRTMKRVIEEVDLVTPSPWARGGGYVVEVPSDSDDEIILKFPSPAQNMRARRRLSRSCERLDPIGESQEEERTMRIHSYYSEDEEEAQAEAAAIGASRGRAESVVHQGGPAEVYDISDEASDDRAPVVVPNYPAHVSSGSE